VDLAAVHEELVKEVRYGIQYVATPVRIAELGDVFDTLILQLEGLGICHLFEYADEGRFRENMARAGMARRYYLRRSVDERSLGDRHLAWSRTRAVLDALVAGAAPLAQDIARLSTAPWNPSSEYEDDRSFYALVHEILLRPDPFPSPAALAIVATHERALEGGKSPHFDVAQALVAKDGAALREALEKLVDAEEDRIEEDRSSPALDEGDILYWPKSRVSIDALAVLKLAEILRIPVAGDFALCPRPARLTWTAATFRDLFEEMDRLR
jgi:hypothetical protein